jgi:hypothetical protein
MVGSTLDLVALFCLYDLVYVMVNASERRAFGSTAFFLVALALWRSREAKDI